MLRLLANRILVLKAESYELHKRLNDMVSRCAPQLLERPGVGPDSAALLIAAGDNPGRLRREGSYAALCGVSPVEASSGDTQRRLLNRGGDRQANAALYRITTSRLRLDQRTQDYLQRRLGDGKTHREAVRCLKRYIACEIFALLPGPARRPALDIHWGIGLTGLPDAINVTWPQVVVQLCVVHLIRASLRYASRKYWAPLTRDPRAIYSAADETAAAAALDAFTAALQQRCPAIVRLWRAHWAEFTPFLAFPPEVRNVIYTTNP
jgi:Transposase, Mutator family/Transposase IS116/IS110/IS902 family